jgi:hypothetical protein
MVWENLELLLGLVPIEEMLPFSRKFLNAEYRSCRFVQMVASGVTLSALFNYAVSSEDNVVLAIDE